MWSHSADIHPGTMIVVIFVHRDNIAHCSSDRFEEAGCRSIFDVRAPLDLDRDFISREHCDAQKQLQDEMTRSGGPHVDFELPRSYFVSEFYGGAGASNVHVSHGRAGQNQMNRFESGDHLFF